MGRRGKRRFYALATWSGAKILRETKPVVPSAMAWAKARSAGPGLADMLASSRRCPDPFQHIRGKWIVRRLAADSSKIELGDLDRAGADKRMKPPRAFTSPRSFAALMEPRCRFPISAPMLSNTFRG
jgi:hypothetical protein